MGLTESQPGPDYHHAFLSGEILRMSERKLAIRLIREYPEKRKRQHFSARFLVIAL